MNRKRPILVSALLLTAVNLLLRASGTGFQVFLSSRIGAAGIGFVQLVLSVGGLATTAAMAGIRTATMYLTAQALGRKQPGQLPWVLSGCFTYSLIASISAGGLVYFFAPAIATGWLGAPSAVTPIRLLAGFLPISCLCGVMTGYFTAANRIGTLTAVEVAEQLCSMAVTTLLLNFLSRADPVRACCCVILGSCLGACLTLLVLVYLRQRSAAPAGPRTPVCRQLLRTAVPLALGDDLRAGLNTAENLMVPRRLALCSGDRAALSAYGMVCGMVFPVLMLPASIVYALAELLIPELAHCAAAGNSARIRHLVKRTLLVAIFYSCVVGGLLCLLSRWLCALLYGSLDAGLWLSRFSMLIPMLYCDAITDAMIKGLGHQTASVRYNILTSALDIGILFLLLPVYGLWGYFISFFVTHLLNFLLSLKRLVKIAGLRRKDGL